MSEIFKYRVRCLTDEKDEYTWEEEEPTVCPTNSSHTIDASLTTQVDSVKSSVFTVQEESTPTGGHFETRSIRIDAAPNGVTCKTMVWPYPVSALAVRFHAILEQEGDMVTCTVGENTTVGVATSACSVPTTWTAQNYVVNDRVLHNSLVYSCTADTVSNEDPTDVSFWSPGYVIDVSATVAPNVAKGFGIRLTDGVNADKLSRIISVDSKNNKLWLMSGPANAYSPSSPTYVQVTAFMTENYELGGEGQHDIGSTKIGATYIPAGIVVNVCYDNKHATDTKMFAAYVDFLY